MDGTDPNYSLLNEASNSAVISADARLRALDDIVVEIPEEWNSKGAKFIAKNSSDEIKCFVLADLIN